MVGFEMLSVCRAPAIGMRMAHVGELELDAAVHVPRTSKTQALCAAMVGVLWKSQTGSMRSIEVEDMRTLV